MNKGPREINRRTFLRRSASVIAFGAATLALPASRAEELKSVENPMRVPGVLPRPYGARSPFEKQTRLGGAGPGAPHGWGANAPNNFNSLTPLQNLHGIITPAGQYTLMKKYAPSDAAVGDEVSLWINEEAMVIDVRKAQ